MIIAVVGYLGYQYVPVAYQASQLKVAIQDAVDKAVVTDKNAAWAEDQIREDAAGLRRARRCARHRRQSRSATRSARRVHRPHPAPRHHLRI